MSLLVSLVAFAVTIGLLNYSVTNDLPNQKLYTLQLITVSIVVLICSINYAFAVSMSKEQALTEDETEDNEENEE